MKHSNNYVHLVRIDTDTGIISIFRQFSDGYEHLYTSGELRQRLGETVEEALERCGKSLGEAILLDSPNARILLNFEQDQE